MTYTYVQLQQDQSLLHSYTQAMIILGDGSSFEFVHNFPSGRMVSIERVLQEWVQTTSYHNCESLVRFVQEWRNRRRWIVLKNKHFFDCFIVPVEVLQKNFITEGRPTGEEWWLQRF